MCFFLINKLFVFLRILHLAEKMGWAHVHSFGKKSLELRYPDSYELF